MTLRYSLDELNIRKKYFSSYLILILLQSIKYESFQCLEYGIVFSVHSLSLRSDHSFSAYAKTFRKTKIPYPLIRTRLCGYQGVRNVSFFGKFSVSTRSMILNIYSVPSVVHQVGRKKQYNIYI